MSAQTPSASGSHAPAGATASAPDLMTILRDGTRARHDAVEARPIFKAPFEADFTVAAYRALLTVLSRAYGTVESEVNRWGETGIFAPLPAMSAYAPAIDEDLATLGPDPSVGAPRPPTLPGPDTAAGVLGARYVIEGSMMGGRHLRKTLIRTFGAPFVTDLTFHGQLVAETDIRTLRAQLAEALSRIPESDHPSALAGAHWAFDCFDAAHGVR